MIAEKCHSMMMQTVQTSHIAKRFARAYAGYRQQAVVQAMMAERLVDELVNMGGHHFDQVLEIGCGSGLLSDCFAKRCTAKRLILNDLYDDIMHNPKHLDTADYHYLIGDISTVKLPDGLDLVLSGASLQWIYPLDQLMARLYQACRSGAVLAFSSFGVDNLCEIRQLTGRGLEYYTVQALRECITAHGWQIYQLHAWHEVLYFDSPMASLRHLKATGVTGSDREYRWTRTRLDEFCQAYQSLATDHGVPLTYHPLIILAKKP